MSDRCLFESSQDERVRVSSAPKAKVAPSLCSRCTCMACDLVRRAVDPADGTADFAEVVKGFSEALAFLIAQAEPHAPADTDLAEAVLAAVREKVAARRAAPPSRDATLH